METIPISPIVKAPVAVEEDISIAVKAEPVQSAVQASPLKANGSIPTADVTGPVDNDELPNYEPNVTIMEDDIKEEQKDETFEKEEEDAGQKKSLDEQIKSLEEEILRKDSFSKSSNSVETESSSPVGTVTVQPVTNNKMESGSTDDSSANHSQAVPDGEKVAKRSGPSCCAVFMFTLMFIVLTLAVVAVVIYNSNISHPIAVELRQQLRFVEPVRDYITHHVQSIFKS